VNKAMTPQEKAQAKKYDPGRDWSAFPDYEAAKQGLRNYWYPVLWARKLKSKKPTAIKLCGEKIMLQRGKDGKPKALHDRFASLKASNGGPAQFHALIMDGHLTLIAAI